MALLAITAALALLLAAAGIYAVMSYATSQRSQEIGIRMALGASSANVQSLVLRDGMRMAASGVAIGFAAALIAARLLRATLLGVGANQVFTIGLAVVVVVVTALLACLLPARRATRIDPMSALRDV
jgi:putative ABC transport system permease protein